MPLKASPPPAFAVVPNRSAMTTPASVSHPAGHARSRGRLRLMDLDTDTLRHIFDELLRQKCLHRLSATCRSLRRATLPILFRYCEITLVRWPIVAHAFPPSSLWPFFQHVSLVDSCDECIYSLESDEPIAVELFAPGFFTDALSSMPLLTELSFYSPYPSVRRFPRPTINSILALPQLRRLRIRGPLFDYEVKDRSLPDSELQSVPLTSLVYMPWDVRDYPRWHVGEQEVLAAVVKGSVDSLETLFIPNETAPLSVMHHSHWPNLRQLRLRGEVRPTQGRDAVVVPYAAILSNMPRLQSLFLEFFIPHGSRVPAIWSSGYEPACSIPWPDLDYLALSHPRVDDQLYRHLPSTLRRLALCSSPYHHHFLLGSLGPSRAYREEWQDLLLTSSELLRILRQCATPGLTYLSMQFFADHAEMEILQFLSRAFPCLEALTVHIYRPDCEHKDIPAEAIGGALAPLARLRTLRMHLGFKGVPGRIGYRGVTHQYFRVPAHDVLEAAVDNAARVLANVLSPSVETMDLFVPTEARPYEWARFVLVRRDTPDRGRLRDPPCVKRELEYAHGFLEVYDWR
ncbi:hypothetical protein OH77DRAFT_1426870 [Trametes cingulata]|nr:hypothetical protein OH77DRAFT_1426870 [Trametes cingulata]